jgi:hypothetical protein
VLHRGPWKKWRGKSRAIGNFAATKCTTAGLDLFYVITAAVTDLDARGLVYGTFAASRRVFRNFSPNEDCSLQASLGGGTFLIKIN